MTTDNDRHVALPVLPTEALTLEQYYAAGYGIGGTKDHPFGQDPIGTSPRPHSTPQA